MRETIPASRKLGAATALHLASQADRIVIARGNTVVRFNMQRDKPDDRTLLQYLLGPTGNLRAPAIIAGGKLFIGFHKDVFEAEFGKPLGPRPRARESDSRRRAK